MNTLWSDVKYAARTLAGRPAFTVFATLTLALGIGATTAIFSVVDAVLLRPLAYPEADALVKINGLRRREGALPTNISRPDYKDFESASAFESMGAHGAGIGAFTLTGDGEPERVAAANVSGGFFPTLRARPAAGRLFTLSDDAPSPPRNVVISHALWQRRFGGAPNAIGRSLLVNGQPFDIVGVLAPDFQYPQPEPDREPQVYALYGFGAEPGRSGRHMRAIGRLKPGVTVAKAQAELSAIASRLERDHPETNFEAGVLVRGLADAITGGSRRALLMLMAAVGLVLLIACANLANLLLARGTSRRKEIAIRGALGAGRWRIARQLLAESALLGVLGGAAGLGLAWASLTALAQLGATSIPRASEIGMDWRVLAFAAAASLLTAGLFGLAPALQLARTDVQSGLRDGTRDGGSAANSRLRSGLIALEVALAVVLLVGAGLIAQHFTRLVRTAPGFATSQVLTLQLSLPTARYAEGTQIAFYEQLYERLQRLPGVDTVGAVNILPLSGNYSCDGFQIVGRPVPQGQQPCAEMRSVSLDYFRALDVPLLSGRTFLPQDSADVPSVVVINEAMARTHFAGQDPIGQSIVYGQPGQPNNTRRIVGVVANVRHFALDREPTPEFYMPQRQQPSYHTMTLALRLAAGYDGASLPPAVRGEVAAMDPLLPLYNIRTMDSLVAQSVAAPRFRTVVLGAFAALAWALALVGVYGVVAYLVGQRSKEIAIRIALGATRADVVRLVMGQGIRPVMAGLGAGLAAAVPLGRLLASNIEGTNAFEPLTFVAVPLAILGAAAVASLVPARRAAGIAPMVVMGGDR